jgi:hypothetical protein
MLHRLQSWLLLLLLCIGAGQLYTEVLGPSLRWDEIRGEGYVTPAFAAEMEGLRDEILAAASRHNRPQLSGMSDAEYAELLATLLYNEHNGWFEDLVPAVRPLRPAFQRAQDLANMAGLGTNYSLWPANLRPSVAQEILERRLPLPGPRASVAVAVAVPGTAIDPARYTSRRALLAAISAELVRPELAIEYLAANVARGVYRAHYEGVPVTWQALAAWHNQGIVRPEEIQASALARSYVMRCEEYRARAAALIAASAL